MKESINGSLVMWNYHPMAGSLWMIVEDEHRRVYWIESYVDKKIFVRYLKKQINSAYKHSNPVVCLEVIEREGVVNEIEPSSKLQRIHLLNINYVWCADDVQEKDDKSSNDLEARIERVKKAFGV